MTGLQKFSKEQHEGDSLGSTDHRKQSKLPKDGRAQFLSGLKTPSLEEGCIWDAHCWEIDLASVGQPHSTLWTV